MGILESRSGTGCVRKLLTMALIPSRSGFPDNPGVLNGKESRVTPRRKEKGDGSRNDARDGYRDERADRHDSRGEGSLLRRGPFRASGDSPDRDGQEVRKARKRFGCLIDIVAVISLLGVTSLIVELAINDGTSQKPNYQMDAPTPWYPGNQPSDPSTPNPMLTTCPKGYVCNGQIPGHPGPTPASGSSGNGSTNTSSAFTPFPNPTVTVTVTIPAPSPKP